MVDFVDNANMFNMPYSLHRVLDIAKYQPMAYVLAPENKRKLDQDMLFQGEKPEAWLDVPIDVSDYEIIDLFNWQNSVKDMISQIEFVRMVDVQSETVERYIKDGKVNRTFRFPLVISGCSTISGRKASATLRNSMAGISLRRRIWRTSS